MGAVGIGEAEEAAVDALDASLSLAIELGCDGEAVAAGRAQLEALRKPEHVSMRARRRRAAEASLRLGGLSEAQRRFLLKEGRGVANDQSAALPVARDMEAAAVGQASEAKVLEGAPTLVEEGPDQSAALLVAGNAEAGMGGGGEGLDDGGGEGGGADGGGGEGGGGDGGGLGGSGGAEGGGGEGGGEGASGQGGGGEGGGGEAAAAGQASETKALEVAPASGDASVGIRVALSYKGRTAHATPLPSDSVGALFEFCSSAFDLPPEKFGLKLILKGKPLAPDGTVAEALGGAAAPKLMVLASAVEAVRQLQGATADLAVKSFAAEHGSRRARVPTAVGSRGRK